MALQVTERAVVGDDLEPVAQRLEAAAWPVTTVAGSRRGQRASRALAGAESADGRRGRVSAASVDSKSSAAAGPPRCRPRGRASPTGHGRRRPGRPVEVEPSRPALAGLRALSAGSRSIRRRGRAAPRARRSSGSPPATPEQHLAVAARLRQRLREQVQDQLLVALAGGEIPMCDSDAAGSSPRSRSSALAVIAAHGREGTRPRPSGNSCAAHAVTRRDRGGVDRKQCSIARSYSGPSSGSE